MSAVDRLAEAEANERNRQGDRAARAFLKQHDDKASARERGYSHGELPGGPTVHLQQGHWQNVPSAAASLVSEFGDLSAAEVDEERRAEGVLADQRYDGDTATVLRRRPIDIRSWLAGWDARAQAEYFAREGHSGVWADQAWDRFLARLKRLPPEPKRCANVVCSRLFQPERSTAKYCSGRCRSKARRDRAATR